MNIIQLQDMLKVMPDDRLQQELSSPTGSVPQYLVLSEVVRRDKLRSDSANKPTTTVVQDLSQKLAPPMPPSFASGGFISASESMGNAGFSGYPTQPPKVHNPISASTGIASMFAPNANPAPPPPEPPQTNTNTNVTIAQGGRPKSFDISKPQPKPDDGQTNDFNSPSFYEQGSYANGGPIKLSAGDYVSRIGAVEAGNDPRAKNPLSSAGGLGQFIDSTWLSYLESTQPGLVDRIGKKAALDLKYDPDLSRQATAWYADQNTKALTSAGFEPNKGNLYLAHFLGPKGATSVLGANPNTPAVSILGEKVANSNPFIKKMTAADLINWTAKKMGDGAGSSGQQGKSMFNIGNLFYGRPYGAGQGAAGFEARAEGLPSPDMATRRGGIMELAGLKPGTPGADKRRADLRTAGIDMMQPQLPQAPAVEMSPGDVRGLARLYSDPAEMAQSMADYSRYIGTMASGGTVRMADGTPRQPFYPVGRFPTKRQAEETAQKAADAKEQVQAEMEAEDAARKYAIDPAFRGVLNQQRGPLGPTGLSTGHLTPDEAALSAARSKPSQYLLYTTALEKSQKAQEDYYNKLAEMQQKQMEGSTDRGAFLRQLGIGMLSNTSSLGGSLASGIQNAILQREAAQSTGAEKLREYELAKMKLASEGDAEKYKMYMNQLYPGGLSAQDQAQYLFGKIVELRKQAADNITDPNAAEQVKYYDSIISDMMRQFGIAGLPGQEASGTALFNSVVRNTK